MKPSELPGARPASAASPLAPSPKAEKLWQYAGDDELPPDSLLQAQVEALRILHIDVPLSAKRQFKLFCSEHFPGLADIIDDCSLDIFKTSSGSINRFLLRKLRETYGRGL